MANEAVAFVRVVDVWEIYALDSWKRQGAYWALRMAEYDIVGGMFLVRSCMR